MTTLTDQQISQIQTELAEQWDQEILPLIADYIKIPNKSVAFDPGWQAHGYMDQAMDLIENWCRKQPIEGMSIERLQLDNRTPLLFLEIKGQSEDAVLMYGHMDKQPEMYGWDENKGPWQPVLENNRLYGRGGADDGYAIFSSLSAIAALQRHGIHHPNIQILIEASEESGSCDLPAYLDALADRLHQPKLIVCLDSGAGNYEQMWSTTSLRGLFNGVLNIKVTQDGMHSGASGGIVPNPFMILRDLLSRIENPGDGRVLINECYAEIPEQRVQQAATAAKVIGGDIAPTYGFLSGVSPLCNDTTELLLNRTWRPMLAVTGMSGLPAPDEAGNITIPEISAKLSMRVAPTADAKQAALATKKVLETNPPFNAKISFTIEDTGNGWHAPELAPWLAKLANDASMQFFNAETLYMGEGGSIPFMGMLGKKFPKAQFLITGVLGPNSNAHGPNEFLDIPYVKKLTGAITAVLAGVSE